jgi:hypothetical protein
MVGDAAGTDDKFTSLSLRNYTVFIHTRSCLTLIWPQATDRAAQIEASTTSWH